MIGPQFAGARRRLGLTVDELADRTRIRPHVIEAIEVDDFSACGGDFYARGHLRTLARVLGVDVAPLLATYDERYADAPIDPRRVFEAELAGAGSIRATRGGPNWSVLVAAVMALILCWSVARLVTGGPDHVADQAVLSGSGGPNHATAAGGRAGAGRPDGRRRRSARRRAQRRRRRSSSPASSPSGSSTASRCPRRCGSSRPTGRYG